MAGQHPTRRQVLEALSAAAIAATAQGFCRWNWAFAQGPPRHTHIAPSAPHRAATYHPVFFTPPQYSAVVALAELILPATAQHRPAVHRVSNPANAGATDAGVAEFIDFMVSQDASLQPRFRTGLQWMDESAGTKDFLTLSSPEQTALLQRIAYKKNFQPNEKPGQDFFVLMRKYTVMGFYTSRIGLESIDYPGLRFYAESPSVPQDAFLHSLGV